MANNWSGQAGNQQSPNPKIQNFLEALRASQSGQSPNTPERHNPFSEFQGKKEIEKKRIEQFHQARYQEWNRVFSAKKQEEAKRLEEIKAELKQLIKQLKNLNTNIVRAVEAEIPEVGEYHYSYLDHLKETIHTFSLKANDANHWLELYNQRAKKQGVYHGMAKKKGTSYTQNIERSIATSVG